MRGLSVCLSENIFFLWRDHDIWREIGGEGHHRLTSPTRRMFSSRSLGEKPRSLFRPKRTLSPSRRNARFLRCSSSSSRAHARVDLPDAAGTRRRFVRQLARLDTVAVESFGCHLSVLRGCTARED